MRYVARSEVDHADKLGAAPVKSPEHLGDTCRIREYAAVGIERSSLIQEPDFEKVNPGAHDALKHADQRVMPEAPVVVVPTITEGTVEQHDITFHSTP